jgi:hypothetical protein
MVGVEARAGAENGLADCLGITGVHEYFAHTGISTVRMQLWLRTGVKQRTRPMLAFKRFDYAAVTISGIELAEKIKKGQFKTGKFERSKPSMSELWSAALAA